MSKNLSQTAVWSLIAAMACAGLWGCGDSAPATPDAKSSASESRAAGDSAPSSKYDQWSISMLNGGKVAHMRTALIPLEGSGDANSPAWREEAEIQMSVARFGEEAAPSATYVGKLNAAGQLLSFEATTHFGQEPQHIRGSLQGGQLVVETKSGPPARFDCPEGCGGFLAVEFALKRQPLQAGETRSLVRYDFVSGTLATEELSAKRLEETPLIEQSAWLLRIEQTTRLAAGNVLTQVIWSDDAGVVRKSQALNTGSEQYLVSKDQALASSEQPVDLAWATSVPLSRPLTNAHDTYRARYRVTLEHSDPASVFPQGAGQTVMPVDERTADLVIKAVRPMPLISGPRPTADTPPTAADLQPNAWIQSDDPRVINLAESTALDEVDSWKVAQSLEQLVHNKMRTHNFNTAMASAAEVVESLEGDCTEHAVLLAALLRARQIPARVAVGLVHTETLGGFGFHMWNEAYINGTWVPLDATLGRGGTGAAHIRLNSTSLAGSDGLTNLLPVAQVMGQLTIDVLEVE